MRRTRVTSAVAAFGVLAAATWMPAGAASPVSDPIVSSEFPVADLATRDAPYDQTMPSIAYDGTNYLVVWSDGRGDNGDIYGGASHQTAPSSTSAESRSRPRPTSS